jgi:hypothetical protein
LAELNDEEDMIIAKMKSQIGEAEKRLMELDLQTDESHRGLEKEKDRFIELKEGFGAVLKEQMVIEGETKKIQ